MQWDLPLLWFYILIFAEHWGIGFFPVVLFVSALMPFQCPFGVRVRVSFFFTDWSHCSLLSHCVGTFTVVTMYSSLATQYFSGSPQGVLILLQEVQVAVRHRILRAMDLSSWPTAQTPPSARKTSGHDTLKQLLGLPSCSWTGAM